MDGSLKNRLQHRRQEPGCAGENGKDRRKDRCRCHGQPPPLWRPWEPLRVKSAAEYEAQLANVSTLPTGTEAEVAARTAEIGDQVLEISNRTGVATADLTDGMYQVVSAFGDSADAAAILETAAKSAAAETRPRRTVSTYCLP